ncbi:hypothetical protein, conserved [Trypanosoma brucei gambiense DAL972]|uniref:BD-FAE-like domain-containing protein n=1 Tax=Trypanosoma brucei gambiense (strain MHOM/CI/86/DAL972) TaxID=679716 RepID=C9ZNY0_TRYB9|nr:hypothetical protein, conserved [Trypanosoma brucei gambiense DAL972]CBH11108.1 hypothetical protein, conserved [Trypanosoma brucei gambiense DAL972]|eukprot:XP_011773395.1 hypothetical protein, conserved [Trypanosoma brucei gambiense DAL972]
MRSYVFGQLCWICRVTVELLMAMGTGAKWMFMLTRLVIFAFMSFSYFVPMVYWYFSSPNIIHRVAYRSAKRSRQRVPRIEPGRALGSKRTVGSTGFENCPKVEEPDDIDTLKSLVTPLLLSRDGRNSEATCSVECAVNDDPKQGTTSSILSDELRGSCGGSVAFSSVYLGGERNGNGTISERAKETRCDNPLEDVVSSDDDEDRQNLNNRARLDIYLPVSSDSSSNPTEGEGTPSAGVENKKSPIVICISGGAWIVGCYLWSGLVARLLATRGYAVFCPDYRNFPQTDMEGMVVDISDAIAWVVHNADRYNGDVSNITLVGQSAGAHLSLMSLLSQAHLHAEEASGGEPPSGAAYYVKRYNPRTSIRRYIGLSGIYNLQELVPHFDKRGLYSSVLYRIAGGEDKLANFSPTAYFGPKVLGSTEESLPENIFDFLPRYIYFLHGDADESAPLSESADIAFAMREKQRLLTRRRCGKSVGRCAPFFTCDSSSSIPCQHTHCSPSHMSSDENGMTSISPCASFASGEPKHQSNGGIRGRGSSELSDEEHRASAVEIRWVKIPDASHTDPFVEEVLVGHQSSLVEFIVKQDDYLVPGHQWEIEAESSEPDEDECNCATVNTPGDSPAEYSDSVTPVMLPDAILPLRVPHESRPLLMRAASYVCPF